MWKFITLILLFLSYTHTHCIRNGKKYEEIICYNMTAHQLQDELNNILNNAIVYENEVTVPHKLLIVNSSLDTINMNLFTNQHLVNIRELVVVNSQVKKIEETSFQKMYPLEKIQITNNLLQNINGRGFPNNIKSIDLSKNYIKQITNICSNDSTLVDLILSGNSLNTIDNLFYNCNNLQLLSLDNCNIKTISTNTFSNLRYLNHLNISHNKLKVLDIHLNNYLWRLDASYNKIKLFSLKPNNENVLSLEYILLNNNHISVIKNNTFINLSNLRELHLENNPITFIEPYLVEHISNLVIFYTNKIIPQLTSKRVGKNCGNNLNLSYSHIETIQQKSFIFCTYVTKLDLSNNKITKLPKHIFNGLNSLRSINLTGNKINIIDTGAFNITTIPYNEIQMLYLSNLTNFEAKSFLGLSNLIKMSVSNSEFETLESASFRFVPSLTEAVFVQNKIKILKSFAFSGSPNLQFLNLSQIIVEFISPGVFLNSGSIQTLDLSYSNFTNFTTVFVGLNSLQNLYLKESNIKSINNEDFCNLKQLRNLDLQGNKIYIIYSFAFSCISELHTLSLKNNEITGMYGNIFKNLTHLSILDLSNNKIGYLNVSLFKDLKNLQELHLENNFITNFETGTFNALNNLLYLNISSNSINSFTKKDLFNLNNLQYLDIRNNNMRFSSAVTIPFEHMNNLRYVGLSNNIWRCYELEKQLNFLRNIGISYKSSYSELDNVYDDINIDGIRCQN